MLSADPRLTAALDRDLVGFVTAVDPAGQPQTSPVWFLRDDDDIVVYNRPRSPRLRSVERNPRVAFNLRADRLASGAVSLEGLATVDADLPPADRVPEYVEKYADQIARLGWTPRSFSEDYSVGLRIRVTRVRSWGLDALGQ